MPPNRASHSATIRSAAPGSVTSAWKPWLRETPSTLAPSSSSSPATAAPMPRLAPVTTHALSCNPRSIPAFCRPKAGRRGCRGNQWRLASMSRPTPHSVQAARRRRGVPGRARRRPARAGQRQLGRHPGPDRHVLRQGVRAGPGRRPPVMRVRGLRQGQATSGTVTVRNPGPGTRYFWLSPGRVTERLGASGGRLTSAVALTVMDVTDISSPVGGLPRPARLRGRAAAGLPGRRRAAQLQLRGRAAHRRPRPSLHRWTPTAAPPPTVGWTWHSLAGRPTPRRRTQTAARSPAPGATARAPSSPSRCPAASSCCSAERST